MCFWYMGIKFCAANVIIDMKKTRGENKDKKDVLLLKKKLPPLSQTALSKITYVTLTSLGLFFAKVSSYRRKIKRIFKIKSK